MILLVAALGTVVAGALVFLPVGSGEQGDAVGQPLTGPTFVVSPEPLACRESADEASGPVRDAAAATVHAVDMVQRGTDGAWYRVAPDPCWLLVKVRGAMAPRVFTATESAELYARELRPPRQPEQGSVIFALPLARTGAGTLLVNNGRAEDSVITLVSEGSVVLQFFMIAGSEYTFSGLTDRTYELFFMTGLDWDDARRKFVRRSGYFRLVSEEPLAFNHSPGGIISWRVTLHSVPGGSAELVSIPPESFPSVAP